MNQNEFSALENEYLECIKNKAKWEVKKGIPIVPLAVIWYEVEKEKKDKSKYNSFLKLSNNSKQNNSTSKTNN